VSSTTNAAIDTYVRSRRRRGGGGKLSAAQRNSLPGSAFALPGRRYPIPDASHARNALARGAQNASPAELAIIKRKVKARFPGIKVS
jgi:hypothetical protein